MKTKETVERFYATVKSLFEFDLAVLSMRGTSDFPSPDQPFSTDSASRARQQNIEAFLSNI